jgi:PilZ domain-containing protein
VEPSDEMIEHTNGWEWPIATSRQQHAERVALMRAIPYDVLHNMSTSPEQESSEELVAHQGKGLSLNLSSGGMLLLMDHLPKVNQAMRVHVPTPVNFAKTPTLAEVRWTRKLPFQTFPVVYFVGLKFLL